MASTRISQASGRFSVSVAYAAAVDGEAAMRAGSDAGIIVAAPVNEIVPALGARPRVIGNLVGRQAGIGADLLRQIVERAAEIFVRDDELAGFVQRRRTACSGSMVS